MTMNAMILQCQRLIETRRENTMEQGERERERDRDRDKTSFKSKTKNTTKHSTYQTMISFITDCRRILCSKEKKRRT
jgi:type VI protein secretion system component VasA